MAPIPHTERLTIVVVGNFNPAIVSPAWLEKEGLEAGEACRNAELEVISPEVSSFTVGAKKLQVLRDRLIVTTDDAREQESIRDLAVGILELLSHTPTSKVGLNYEALFVLPSTESWHRKGHLLAPKEPWADLIDNPGLVNITMRESREDGYFDVRVGPAPAPANALSVRTNAHHELGADATAEDVARLVRAKWTDSVARSRSVAATLARETNG